MLKTEIFFNEKISYKVYRYECNVHAGGGVLITVNDQLASSNVPVVSALEFVSVLVGIDNRACISCACYRPSISRKSFCNDLHYVLNNLTVRYPMSPLFLLGDFNFSNILWTSDLAFLTPAKSPYEDAQFLNLCSDFNLHS